MKPITDAEVEKRIKVWADVTILSIELKRADFRKRYPDFNEDEIRELMRKEYMAVNHYKLVYSKRSYP